MKRLVRRINRNADLYRDDKNGIAYIYDHSSGIRISVHPNISSSGSVSGMKACGFWAKKDRIVRSGGFLYNIDRFVCCKDDELEVIVSGECMCQACLKRRMDL